MKAVDFSTVKGRAMKKAQVIDFLKGYKRALIDEQRIYKLLEQITEEKGKESLVEELRKKLGVLELKKGKIVRVIDNCPEAYCRLILTDHYVCGRTFEAIAEDVNFSVRHVCRLHDKAIAMITKKI